MLGCCNMVTVDASDDRTANPKGGADADDESADDLISLLDSVGGDLGSGDEGALAKPLAFLCCGSMAPIGGAKKKSGGVYVCKDHAFMYQQQNRNSDYLTAVSVSTKGRRPSVTIDTKRRLLDEFRSASRNLGVAQMMAHAIKSRTSTSSAGDPALEKWLNLLLLFIWPRMSRVVQNAMDDLVEPAIREAVPQIKESFEIYTVMGTVPPTLGPMKSFRDDNSCDSMSMEIGITWKSDLKVKATAKFLTVKVDRVEVFGTIVVKMCPLLDQIPLIGALHIYFLDPPSINLRIRVENSPVPLSNIVRNAVDQGVRDALVLPNRILAPVACMYQLQTIRPLHNPPPRGVLRLTVLEMRNLPAADFSMFGAGSSDPYAEVSVGAQNWKSDKVMGTLNPVFAKGNVELFFFFTNHQNVRLKVWDYDRASGDDVLGEAKGLTINGLVGEKWFDVEVASEFRSKGKKDEDKNDEMAKPLKGGCLGKKKKNATNAPTTNAGVPADSPKTKRESLSEVDNAKGVAQVRLKGEILVLSEKSAHVRANTECMLEIAILGVRGASGCTEPRDFLMCSVTLNEETRWTPASFLNVYDEPSFVENKIDPSLVDRLAQTHSVVQVASIMNITAAQVEACLRAGHDGIWCHSFFYHTTQSSGEIEFKINDHSATMTFDDLSALTDMTLREPHFAIGPFLLDVTLRLRAIVVGSVK
eukprot:GEMP01014888.1.p1 GENE.GEMP01014888.1~~GEMP01014888.1.p1  ORF type:complete len:699 (+),score=207.58 GEMP01014888.1:190-2286(+)